MDSDHNTPFAADPDHLLVRWRALLAAQPHIHLPTAAAALGVAEAALVAARVGNGAVRLAPQLTTLLAGIETWRTLFVVTPNRLGVMIAILKVTDSRAHGDGTITLHGVQHHITLDATRVRHCYLFEDQGIHGHSTTLCWFDDCGAGMGKLLLRSRMGQDIAVPHWMEHALPDQSRVFAGCTLPMPACKINNPQAEEMMRRALASASRLESVALSMQGGALTSRYCGSLGAFQQTPGALHLSSVGCKLHLRPAAAQSATPFSCDDGMTGLSIQTGNGTLRIAPGPNTRLGECPPLKQEKA